MPGLRVKITLKKDRVTKGCLKQSITIRQSKEPEVIASLTKAITIKAIGINRTSRQN